MSYYSHIAAITAQIETLVADQFSELNVRHQPMYESDQLGKRHEYIRFFYDSDNLVSRNSDGETRDFVFNVSYYFHNFNRRADFSDHVFYQVERLNWILCNEPTQNNSSDEYVWHDGRMEGREFIQPEDDSNVYEVQIQFVVTKTCMWGTLANYAAGIYNFSDYGYSVYG